MATRHAVVQNYVKGTTLTVRVRHLLAKPNDCHVASLTGQYVRLVRGLAVFHVADGLALGSYEPNYQFMTWFPGDSIGATPPTVDQPCNAFVKAFLGKEFKDLAGSTLTWAANAAKGDKEAMAYLSAAVHPDAYQEPNKLQNSSDQNVSVEASEALKA